MSVCVCVCVCVLSGCAFVDMCVWVRGCGYILLADFNSIILAETPNKIYFDVSSVSDEKFEPKDNNTLYNIDIIFSLD